MAIERDGHTWVYMGVSEGANWFAVHRELGSSRDTLLACPANRDGSLPEEPWEECCDVDEYRFEKLGLGYDELLATVARLTEEPGPQDCEEESTP